MIKLHFQTLIKFLPFALCIVTNIAKADAGNLIRQQFTQQAEQFVLSQLNPDNSKNIEIAAIPIDKRIQIPVCSNPVNFSASPEALSQSNITVKAMCSDNNWYMYLVIKAVEIQPVVVFSSAVSPGTLITASNTHVVNMNKKRLRSSTFADIKDVIGARIKRRVSAGRPVNPNNLCYVCKGDSVTISAGTSSMRVKTTGIALEDGNMGETIQVKNRSSNKKVYARVASTGQVEINI